MLFLRLLITALLMGACSTVPAPPPEFATLFRDSSFRPTALPPPAEITAVSEEMRRYLASDIAVQLRREGRLRGLVSALEKNTQLKLEYDATRTRTAAEAFAGRRGNCLSLTLMTAALARELGLVVSYRNVHVDEQWNRLNGMIVGSGHVNIVLEPNRIDEEWKADQSNGIVIDFQPHADIVRQRAVAIDERTVLSMFMNNRAVEQLAVGDMDAAYAWARQAIITSPHYMDAYNTLGVIYLRGQMKDAAQQVFAAVLQQEGENLAAMVNLVDVLERLGRTTEAAQWRERLQRIEAHPPFYHFDQGIAALKLRDFAAAREHFSKELARNAYYPDALFGLAVAKLGMGDPSAAERHLQQAIAASNPGKDRDLYAAKLAWLQKARSE